MSTAGLDMLKSFAKRLPVIAPLVRERDALCVRADAAERRADSAERRLAELREEEDGCTYNADGMRLYGKNAGFREDPAFARAYQAGANSDHQFPFALSIEWRVHVACWAACHAKHLVGDLVECGVNTGVVSLAVCHYIEFNRTGKSFFLFDTFRGIPEEQMAPSERTVRLKENAKYYHRDCFEVARRNFAPFPKAVLVRGKVPDTLGTVEIGPVAYLHLDMNIAAPEVAALEFFWEKLVRGAIVLLDDYGWTHYENQYHAMNTVAARRGVAILTLPTGQGLLIKP